MFSGLMYVESKTIYCDNCKKSLGKFTHDELKVEPLRDIYGSEIYC